MNAKEVLQKEEEKHQLLKIGIVSNWQMVAAQVLNSYYADGTNHFDKNEFLSHFYHTIRYNHFIRSKKNHSALLKKHWFGKAASFLAVLQKEEPAVLDKELKVNPRFTLAYHLSENIFNTVYSSFCLSTATFNTPDDVQAFFLLELKEKYPLSIDGYVEELKRGDASFWDITCRYIKDTSVTAVAYALEKYGYTGNYDIIRDHTWSSAYELIRKRLINKEGKVPTFHNGKNFRNYIIQACLFLADNLYKKYTGKESYIAEAFPASQGDGGNDACWEGGGTEDDGAGEAANRTDAFAVQPFEDIEAGIKELDIDINNSYEVAYAVSIILLNSEHPLHRALVEGIEDKVSLLMDKAVQGLNYNEIVEERYGNMETDEFRKAVVKARKDYERVRKILTGKLIALIKE
ncbi:hypothetical protein FACS1894181_14350 [Bacteroidia bacterium]|nr:hypothetical protein FACS1894181_14350 [Bacteroidia bacterium]